MKDNLFTREQAREKIMSGILKCKEAVGCTMGSAGWNSVIEAIENPGFMNTNDGSMILNSIRFSDPLEELGRKFLLEAVNRANKVNGDGSSGTTVMTASILEEGQSYIGTVSPIELKKSLEDCIPLIEEAIKKQAREITVDNVKDVCTISAEDEKIGSLIQEIYQKIGKDGIIHWDLSKTTEDSYSVGNGITLVGAGIASLYMFDRDKTSGQFLASAKLKNPRILIAAEKLTTAADFENLFLTLHNQGEKEVVVFCDDFEVNVIAQLVATQQVQGFRTVVVKMPVLWKDQWYEDLAVATGATVLSPVLGTSIKNAKLEHLGTVGNIIITKDETFIDGVKDLSAHISKLESEGNDESSLRASRLNIRTARFYIGAHSESALAYKRFKVEDAIAAGWQALHHGIVAGGGSALVSIKLPDTIGGKILSVALKAPAKQIASNAGVEDQVIDDRYTEVMGFNSKTKEFCNMFDAKIVDPANIIINSCKNAISVAASALTANTVVLLPKEDPQPYQPGMIMR